MQPIPMVDLFVVLFIVILIYCSSHFRPNGPRGPRGRFRF